MDRGRAQNAVEMEEEGEEEEEVEEGVGRDGCGSDGCGVSISPCQRWCCWWHGEWRNGSRDYKLQVGSHLPQSKISSN